MYTYLCIVRHALIQAPQIDLESDRHGQSGRTVSAQQVEQPLPRVPTDDNKRFEDHFKAKHLKEGETYTTRHRDEYEWACREPARVETPEGARLNLFELLGAVDNKPTRIDDRLHRIEGRQYSFTATITQAEIAQAAINNEIVQEIDLSDADAERIQDPPVRSPEPSAAQAPQSR
ncbi:hypothetical protein JG687_00014174 [Phytophthora cactorum]|uniref:Uncharacterized protein n=1 Tax=Phytophthora cactorum TaxID=29920 RepID=A0A8T1U2A4_9STRA|nr:hypothetical protein PC120_g15648 [Phytophthora cactorum]KAG3068848.1 hypothetical protein PC121_g10063 [Phytophthora cactorum]KAG4054941.1 hypothetical protein PC123_g9949 [Phytophthora cactorum]KAG6950559.1 hypothetical protein JG687_00014174 [Phytophthora cactorum]